MTLAGETIIAFATWFASSILYFVGYFFSKLVIAAGYILNWTLALNSQIMDNPAVQIGWKITRDISNLGFVFLIIIIAFSTILRTGDLQIKKALPKLIIAALLINFSLLIAAVFLDFAGILMNFFFNSAYTSSGGDGGIAMALTGALSIHGFLKTPEIGSVAFAAFSTASLNYIASLIFLDIATVIGAITLMAIGFMFLIRYIIIGFLLIMLPAAILAWVIGGKGWSTWTGKFFQYTFFGPVAGFYIYIALKTSQAIATLSGTQLSQVVSQDPSGVISNIAGYLGSLIIMVAMLLYGLSQAEKQCEIGGKQAVNLAKGLTGKIAAAPFRYGRASLNLAAEKASKSANPILQKWGTQYKASSQRFEEGVIRGKQAVKKVTEFGGRSSIGSIYSTALQEIGGPLGYKGRHSDEDIKKKMWEAKDKAEDRVKLLDKYIGIERAVLDKIFAAHEKEKDNSKSRDLLEKIDKLKQLAVKNQMTIADANIHQALADNMGNYKDARKELNIP